MKAIAFYDVTSSSFFNYIKFARKFSLGTKGNPPYHIQTFMFDYENQVVLGTDGKAIAIYHLPEKHRFSELVKSCMLRIEGKVLFAYDGEILNYKRVYPENAQKIELKLFDETGKTHTISEFNLEGYYYSIKGLFELIRSMPVGVNVEYLEKMKGHSFTVHHTLDTPSRPVLFKESVSDSVKIKDGWVEVVIMPMRDEVYHDFSKKEM